MPVIPRTVAKPQPDTVRTVLWSGPVTSSALRVPIFVCLFRREPSFLPPVRRAVASKCGSTRPVDRRGANSPVAGRLTSDIDVYRTEVVSGIMKVAAIEGKEAATPPTHSVFGDVE